MTAKEFFKSTAFKCIAVLLGIVLVCGILLTVCNSLFYVSDEERLGRAISKLYGEEVTYEVQTVDDEIDVGNGKINAAYLITSENFKGEYLLDVSGNDGYNGPVVCFVVVKTENGAVKVKKASIKSSSDSYIAYATDGAIQQVIDNNPDGASAYAVGDVKTGASYSMGAISNAMNCAVKYVKSVGGQKSKFDGYSYTKIISDESAVSVSGSDVSYEISTTGNRVSHSYVVSVTVGSDKTVKFFSVLTAGSTDNANGQKTKEEYNAVAAANAAKLVGKDAAALKAIIGDDGNTDDKSTYEAAELSTGATRSSYQCIYAALFAVANYDRALADFAQGGNA